MGQSEWMGWYAHYLQRFAHNLRIDDKKPTIQIERVQRRATKLVPECKEMNYENRLRYLKIFSLKGRRLRGDLIQMYEILQGLDEVNKDKIIPMAVYRVTRNQELKLRRRYSRTDIRKHTFINRKYGINCPPK